MDSPSSSLYSLLDELDELPIPPRSPSRLDFCVEDMDYGDSVLEMGGDSAMYSLDAMGWASSNDDRPYAFIEEETLEIDIAPLDHSSFPIVESAGGKDDDPPRTTDTPSTFPTPQDHPMDQVVPEPLAPVPVRPPSMQFEVDAQGNMLPCRTAPQRLNYPHHGFSRSALQQQKTLWNSRHEEWVEWELRLQQDEEHNQDSETNDAYTGLATLQPSIAGGPPYARIPPSGLERDLADYPPKKYAQDVNASIYPRAGDISALRDPYSTNLDRSFFRYPLWTLHKALYVFDMHQRSASFAPSASVCKAGVKASTSSSTLSSYTSSTSGDDQESDSTLVADDSPISPRQHPSGSFKCAASPHSPPPWNRFCGWGPSWYAKWELLNDLFQHDQARYNSLGISMKLAEPSESNTALLSPLESMFRSPVGEDENNHDHDDDDDDEDYGTLISHSSFSVDFEEECERAMAFYTREYKCSEMAL